VLGGAHPLVASIELGLRDSRAVLAATDAPQPESRLSESKCVSLVIAGRLIPTIE